MHWGRVTCRSRRATYRYLAPSGLSSSLSPMFPALHRTAPASPSACGIRPNDILPATQKHCQLICVSPVSQVVSIIFEMPTKRPLAFRFSGSLATSGSAASPVPLATLRWERDGVCASVHRSHRVLFLLKQPLSTRGGLLNGCETVADEAYYEPRTDSRRPVIAAFLAGKLRPVRALYSPRPTGRATDRAAAAAKPRSKPLISTRISDGRTGPPRRVTSPGVHLEAMRLRVRTCQELRQFEWEPEG